MIQLIDAHLYSQTVEIDITGLINGLAQINFPVASYPGCPPVPIPVKSLLTRQPVPARVINGVFLGGLPREQTCKSDDRFDRRARLILAQNRPIKQRRINRIPQSRVGLIVNPCHEQVGVISRLTDHRQDTPCFRLNSDNAASTLPQRRHSCTLQRRINVQREILTGYRQLRLQDLHDPTTGISLYLLVTDFAKEV